MFSRATNFGLTTIAVLLLAACSTPTQTVKLYEDPVSPPKRFERFLIIDVSADLHQRRLFESEIVKSLIAEHVAAVPSYENIGSSNGMQKSELHELSAKVGADAILITHLVSVDTSSKIREGREQIVSVCRRGDPFDYFLYDYEIISEPDSTIMAHTVVVAIDLYDAASHKRIWGIQSTCFNRANMSEVWIEEANAIVRQLRNDGYVQ